jgi:LPXTG-motif cell wall-anchored protein
LGGAKLSVRTHRKGLEISMRQFRGLVAILTVGVLALLAFAPSAAAQQSPVTVQLAAQNGSGITGTVTLTDIGNSQTRVVVNVTPTTGDHPAHIHMGSCANLDPTPEFPLNNVQNGTSTTVVAQPLATIMRSQRAVNLHMSATDLATYVACGDIPVVGSQPPSGATTTAPAAGARPAATAPVQLPRTGDVANPAPLMLGSGLVLVGLGLLLRRRFVRT